MVDHANLVATIIMALATLVMMYTSCQQTRIANNLERMTEQQERVRMIAAKREMQKVAFDTLFLLTPSAEEWEHIKTKADCLARERRIAERMDIMDNYFLYTFPDQAKKWDRIRNRFYAVAHPLLSERNIFTIEGTNSFYSKDESDQKVVGDFKDRCSKSANEFMEIYVELGLSELLPPRGKQ